MIRIVGILCGSAIAVSLLIVALGLPEVLPDSSTTVLTAVEDSESAKIDERVSPSSSALIAPSDEQIQVSSVAPAILDLQPEPVALSTYDPDHTAPPAAMPSTGNWYAFWSPFRSEIAANGFIAQLYRTTLIDYRVVRLKPGVYEVAFAYREEQEIERKLATISAATGLEMPDG